MRVSRRSMNSSRLRGGAPDRPSNSPLACVFRSVCLTVRDDSRRSSVSAAPNRLINSDVDGTIDRPPGLSLSPRFGREVRHAVVEDRHVAGLHRRTAPCSTTVSLIPANCDGTENAWTGAKAVCARGTAHSARWSRRHRSAGAQFQVALPTHPAAASDRNADGCGPPAPVGRLTNMSPTTQA